MSGSQSIRGDFNADRRMLILGALALVIGAFGAVVAWALIQLIRFFTNLFFFGEISVVDRAVTSHHLGIWVIGVPVLGSLLIGLMARYGSEKIRGHGIPEALEAILFGKSLMNPKVAILKPISSAISIGSGGPFGAEGPIIMTGGAFGSLFAQIFHLTDAERKTLLVAGAAAGMTAIFGTPIAAVLLSIELLLFEWKPRSLVPVSIAAIVAYSARGFFFSTGALFPVQEIFQLSPSILFWSALVGIAAGAFATLVSSGLYRLEDLFQKLPIHWMWWPMLGGLVVGIGGYFEPRVLGVGYDVIGDFLSGNVAASEGIRLVAIKALVWVFALASGTSGGVLAPLLIFGAGLGSLEARFLPIGDPSLWALISMAAILGGMMRSPFMACVFALELTWNFSAFPAVFTGVVFAYAFTVMVMKRSILTEKIARRGYDIFREYGVDPLERVRVSETMTKNVETVPPTLKSADAIKLFTEKKRKGYPVVDSSGELKGMITASNFIAENGIRSEEPSIEGVMSAPAFTIGPDESCRAAADRMAMHGIGRLAVVSGGASSRLIGIVTRSDLLKARVKAYEEETQARRFLKPF